MNDVRSEVERGSDGELVTGSTLERSDVLSTGLLDTSTQVFSHYVFVEVMTFGHILRYPFFKRANQL